MIERTEKSIMKNWKTSNPMVSIRCLAYNHEDYIADALDGFLIQKTTFPFEVVVHEDASTDNTAIIIREYAKKYPRIIKPIFQTENQYSKHNGAIVRIFQSTLKGKYIAFCEGDDYWTDENKLQMQFDIMESNPSIDMCAHKSAVVDSTTGSIIYYTAALDKDGIIPCEMLINAHGSRVVDTATLFYRRELMFDSPKYREILRMDTTLRIQGALRGGIYYINRSMSVYRNLSKGSWTATRTEEQWRELNTKMIEMYRQLDEDTQHRYHNCIRKEIVELEFRRIRFFDDLKKVLRKQEPVSCNPSIVKKGTFAFNIKLIVKTFIVGIVYVKRYIKSLFGAQL